MTPDLSPEAWAQIRYDYEQTTRTVEDICLAHGISSGTLRDRMRRWGWARRRPPIPREGPARLPAPTLPSPASGGGIKGDASERAFTPVFDGLCRGEIKEESSASVGGLGAPDACDSAIVPRLQGAVARGLPAIETTLATLGAGPMPPREMEQAARALGSLTRTLRELSGLLSQRQAQMPYDEGPEDIDEFRRELPRKMDAFIEARTGKTCEQIDREMEDRGEAQGT